MTSDEKFPKKEHILKTGDFRAAYKDGLSRKAGGFFLCRKPNGLGHNRLGLSIAASRVGLAARRNRIKRLVREAYRKNKGALKAGFDIIVGIKQDPGRMITYKAVESIFLKLAKDTGLAQ